MAHQLSAAEVKRGRLHPATRQEPTAGSRIRRLWDVLQAHKGELLDIDRETLGYPVSNGGNSMLWTDLSRLQDSFGLDIRIKNRATPGKWHGGKRNSLYCLAGEWFGKVYVDYIAEKVERENVELR